MIAKGRHGAQKITHCPNGHEYTTENTVINARGARSCGICNRAKQRIARGWPKELLYTNERLYLRKSA
jgi:hypothetical protein